MYHYELSCAIEEFIANELNDSIYYEKLASKAPNTFVRKILTEFSNDEKSHAENFRQAYYYITGRLCLSQPVKCCEIPDFEEALKNRILSETKDYKKYGEHYISAHNNYLRDLFFLTKMSEARHAMRIPILFKEITE